jgi:hypothetical protein
LPYSDVQGLSEDEIAGKLIELYLEYFLDPQAPDHCRIVSFTIDDVIDDEHTQFMYKLHEFPNCVFIRVVMFSIQQNPRSDFWGWQDEFDQQDWLHTGEYVAVLHYSSFYELKITGP